MPRLNLSVPEVQILRRLVVQDVKEQQKALADARYIDRLQRVREVEDELRMLGNIERQLIQTGTVNATKVPSTVRATDEDLD